ncbi:MAG: MFS transporter [Paracoccaceae bacterium]|nr:MFS transporter [Paracoccaceae bacterium]
MSGPSAKRRVWGWYFFDWASQPYHTVLLTFIFGPFFAAIATEQFMSMGMEEQAADARAQSIWSLCLTITGLIIGFGGPVIGAFADTAGRRMPWIFGFSILYIIGAGALWWTDPGGSNLIWALVAFGIGFIGAEFALIFTNAQLPSLGSHKEVGKISGSGFAFGYTGGLIALAILLVFFVEQASGRTIAGLAPIFGLDPEAREGTRFAGPFAAIWFAIFMIPYFLWVRDPVEKTARHSITGALSSLGTAIKGLTKRPSLASYLGGSMLYRDALNGLYGFGGTYALLVLNWEVTQVGVFGIISGLSAAAFSWVGGLLDRRFGPKPVIVVTILGLMLVCFVIVNMSREAFFGMELSPDSTLPDAVFFGCGMLIGGFGGTLQAASRSMMVRHANPEAPTESFGLYGLSGRATAFLAPALIGAVTTLSGDARIGVAPLIFLFLCGLVLLRWVKPDGDRAEQWEEQA